MVNRIAAHFFDEDFAETRNAAHERDIIVHLIVAEMRARIGSIDEDVGTVAVERAIDSRIFHQANYRGRVSGRHPMIEDVPGHGAIHGAGVHVIEPDLFRERPRHTAFSRGRRPVDCDNPMSAVARAHSSSTFAGVSELMTGVVTRTRFALTNSSRVFSKPGYDSRTHSTS